MGDYRYPRFVGEYLYVAVLNIRDERTMTREKGEGVGFKGTRLGHGAPYGPLTAVRRVLERRRRTFQEADFESALESDADAYDVAKQFAKSD